MISGSEYVNKLFETMYAKFLDTIEKYDLIPADTEKVCLGMSGGKDAQVMTLLMNEYKKRVRPDLELELLIVKTPSWKYEPDKYYEESYFHHLLTRNAPSLKAQQEPFLSNSH